MYLTVLNSSFWVDDSRVVKNRFRGKWVDELEVVEVVVVDCSLSLNDLKIAVGRLATPAQDEVAVDGHCCRS